MGAQTSHGLAGQIPPDAQKRDERLLVRIRRAGHEIPLAQHQPALDAVLHEAQGARCSFGDGPPHDARGLTDQLGPARWTGPRPRRGAGPARRGGLGCSAGLVWRVGRPKGRPRAALERGACAGRRGRWPRRHPRSAACARRCPAARRGARGARAAAVGRTIATQPVGRRGRWCPRALGLVFFVERLVERREQVGRKDGFDFLLW